MSLLLSASGGSSRSRGTAFLLLLLLLLLLLSSSARCASADTFDALPLLEQHAQQLSDSDLSSTLQLLIDILSDRQQRQGDEQQHAAALRQYAEQLQAVLQPDCCDYFMAMPTVKSLASALSSVLSLQLPAALRPVVRRSYVAAIWLLQRSRFFKWDSSSLQKSALPGLYKLYDQHMSVATNRSISFHHVSKTGGTTLCGVAWDNGCRGPKMSKKDNCMLNTGLDQPVWVRRHNVTTVNSVAAMPPPPPAPPVMAEDTVESAKQLREAVAWRVAKRFNYDWFMYDCPVDQLVARKVGRPCGELQAGAANKSATFFASENTLPFERGATQVCESFLNVVVLRDAVSEAVSLMTEVTLVYTRLLKQHRVLGWSPPKHDLAWWQQWAPAVVNNYAARTLLGPAAFCPVPLPEAAAEGYAEAAGAGGGSSSGSSSSSRVVLAASGSSSSDAVVALSERDARDALKLLASFDVVLDLASSDLMDTSLNKLLGWTAKTVSEGRQQRTTHVPRLPTWEQLELLVLQEAPPPPPPPSAVIIVPKHTSSANRTRGGLHFAKMKTPPAGHQQGQPPVPAAPPPPPVPGSVAVLNATEQDEVRRMLAEVRVREVYSRHGMSNVLLPLAPEVPLLRPAKAVMTEAMAALRAAQHGPLKAFYVADSSSGSSSHLLVELQLEPAAPNGSSSSNSGSSAGLTAAGAGSPSGGAPAAAVATYHVWPRHGVLLTVPQYEQLLRSTAVDALLYQHARVLQALDAGMGAVLGAQRKVRRMLSHAQEQGKASCGFAGLARPRVVQ